MGVEVHVRSVFLQGLLLMANSKRPNYFNSWDKLLQRWDNFLLNQQYSPLAASLAYVKSQLGITQLVVGVENLNHLEGLLTAWDLASSIEQKEIRYFASDDPGLIEPGNWILR